MKKNSISLKDRVDFSTERGIEAALSGGLAVKCEECGKVMIRITPTHLKRKCTGKVSSVKEYMNKHGTPIAPVELCKATTLTIDTFIKRYGDEEGLIRWDEYKIKQAHSNTYEFKKDKHGWSKEEYDEFNKSRSVTEINLIKKHGAIKGKKIYKDYVEKQRYTCSIEYFIEKYGEVNGIEKYNNFSEKRRLSGRQNDGFSKVELECYNELSQYIPNLEWHVFLGNEYFGAYDYGSVEKRKLIEFYGDFWHCNPLFYQPNYVIKPKNTTADFVWYRDKTKREYAMAEGYQVMVIWENDWKRNKEQTIKNVMEWWSNGD